MKALNGRKKNAVKELRSLGGKFRKPTAISLFRTREFPDPEGIFNYLLKKGFIEKTPDGCYIVK